MSPDNANLAARLAKQIETSGSISVADFMQAANQAYYAKGDPLGVNGDFITAPEISQMFGELIGLWLTDIWMRAGRPEGCKYVELGPGRGTLAADAMRSMKQFDFVPEVLFVETSEALREMQAQAVADAAFLDIVADIPYDAPLLIVANEFFDALPVRQLVSTHSGWRERVVVRDRGTKFMATPGMNAMDEIVPAEFRNAPSPSIYETCPAASSIMYELAGRIAANGGAMLIADYGYTLPGIGSTLQAVRAHEYADPFENPGKHDLTAHVNFVELANLARMRDLRVSGPVEQGSWLKALGIDARTQVLSASRPEQADEMAAARDRLVEATGMGSLFKILAISHAEWPDPEGFAVNQSLG
ncbi:MAG: SAM-dependent methyltransferase [Sphingorhabdus sp.]|uniref:class I SAM-dependent methyltransferase n=1 Tax=Sphingorhabdus sp. TaxID=1902408 RepID=UPI003C871D5B